LKNAVTQKVTHDAMIADFEGPDVDDRFRRLLSKAKPIKWGFFHHPYTSTYYRDRVVLLGDSAHASLPFQAAGAGQGLEDALVLSKVLAKIHASPDHDTALGLHIRAGFAAYDSIRRPRAQRQLERAHEMSHMIHLQHPETGSDMNKVILKLQREWFDWVWFHNLDADIQSALLIMDQIMNAQV
jgi:salicylate hydroxylase